MRYFLPVHIHIYVPTSLSVHAQFYATITTKKKCCTKLHLHIIQR